jgi:hypothetical protein
MTKILIVGPSHATTDARFPDLHWSEKILNHSADHEVINFAMGGSTNAMIDLQLRQGLRFRPDFVILLFTEPQRFEIDHDPCARIGNIMSHEDIVDYNFRRYTTTSRVSEGPLFDIWTRFTTLVNSDDFDLLRNYFTVENMLFRLDRMGIPFCFTLGGLPQSDIDRTLSANFLVNDLGRYADHRLHTDLWAHSDLSADAPDFHVKDSSVHEQFAYECLHHLKNSKP